MPWISDDLYQEFMFQREIGDIQRSLHLRSEIHRQQAEIDDLREGTDWRVRSLNALDNAVSDAKIQGAMDAYNGVTYDLDDIL